MEFGSREGLREQLLHTVRNDLSDNPEIASALSVQPKHDRRAHIRTKCPFLVELVQQPRMGLEATRNRVVFPCGPSLVIRHQ